uniref:Uncharacterized protein n=1 Tax=Ditylenchus dipsaci TaxID=166011 RepID=A0A915EDI3_9BILA
MFLHALIITNKLSLKTILSKSAVRKQVRRIRIRNRIPVVEARRVEDVQIPAAMELWKVRIELTTLLRLRVENCRMLWEWNIPPSVDFWQI